MRLCHVTLISCENYYTIVFPQRPSIFNPFGDAIEGLTACDVVNYYRHCCVFDIGRYQTLEALLTCSVPKVHNDDFIFNVHFV